MENCGVKIKVPTTGVCDFPSLILGGRGHEMDDYRATFREMARARFNRIIIWNNQRVINALPER